MTEPAKKMNAADNGDNLVPNVKVKPWPNGLGWDVGDAAEIWKLKNGLHVCVFTEDCKIKFLFIANLSLDPIEAVERCRKEGKIDE